MHDRLRRRLLQRTVKGFLRAPPGIAHPIVMSSAPRRTALALVVAAACLTASAALADPSTSSARAIWATIVAPFAGTSEAIGGYSAGCLTGGVRLPPEGRGYQAVELRRRRHFGHPVAIEYVRQLGRRVAERSLGSLLIGDISQPGGGPMSWGHASHQIGLDIDIWLRLDVPALPRPQRRNLEHPSFIDPETKRVNRALWTDAHAELVHIAATDERVSRIFIDAGIKRDLCDRQWRDRSWLRRLRHWPHHDDHMHVRLSCPEGSPECQEPAPLPPGEGCGPELDALIDAPPQEPPPRRAARREPPPLPPRCLELLSP